MLAFAWVASACGGDAIAPCSISVSITPFAPAVVVGATLALTATPDAANCAIVPAAIWSSNSEAVAAITSAGVVTGVSPGSAIITASIGTGSDTAVVTVTAAPVSTIEVTFTSVTMGAGTTQQATATLRAANGQLLTGRAVAWSSAATGVAQVNPTTGIVSGVAGGTAVITATSEGRTGSATVIVSSIPVSTITVTTPSATMFTNATLQATAVLRDAGNAILTDRTVTWTSSAPAIAAVNATTGLITSSGNAGAVTIIGAAEGKVGTVNITVTVRPVAAVTLTAPSAMAVGATQQVTAVLTDVNNAVLTGRVITWTSSAGAVASVSQTGLITGLTSGVTIITALSEGRSATIGMTVVILPGLTSLSPNVLNAVFSSVSVVVTGTNMLEPGTDLSFNPGGFFTAGFLQASSATAGTIDVQPASASSAGVGNFQFRNNTVIGPTKTVTIFAIGTSPIQIGASFGGAGGSPFASRDCPANSVATGLNGRGSANVDQLAVRCQTVTGTTRTFGAVVATASAGGAGGTAFTLACGANQVMVGVTPQASNAGTGFWTAVAAVCAPIGGGANLTTGFGGTPSTPGAAATTLMCPLGLAVFGIEGNSGAFIDKLSIRCR